jgi:hypothetical protein
MFIAHHPNNFGEGVEDLRGMPLIERWREALTVGLIAVFLAIAVYTLLGFAWTFKTAVEFPQRLRASLSRTN